MKKIAIVLLSVFTLSLMSMNTDTVIPVEKLPAKIKEFVATHFAKNKILQASTENEVVDKKYEVVLEGNIKLEFNKKEEVIEIKSKTKLPESVIPAKIKTYVKTNYPKQYVISWEKDGKKQEVKLNDGLELEFTHAGDFVKIDK